MTDTPSLGRLATAEGIGTFALAFFFVLLGAIALLGHVSGAWADQFVRAEHPQRPTVRGPDREEDYGDGLVHLPA